MWSAGEVTVDVRDLGISGQLSFEDREGLAELQRRVREGNVGAVYLTEGVSRLSRDRDRILPYQLLKLLKEHKVRIRTLYGVWNPAIERDYDHLAEEFEEAISELKVMSRRMHRRKVQKASRGEYVGEPIPAGYILPITGQKPTGEYEYGRMEAYQLATRPGKPKGRAANFEPNEWSGLLQCMNHPEPRKIRSLNSKARYICNRGYFQEGESVCLDITGRFLDEPLTATVLRQLDLTPFTEEILARLESDSDNRRLEEVRLKQQTARIEREIRKWQALLPSCVDDRTGKVDREREEYYWARRKEAQMQLEEIKSRPAPEETQVVDYERIREFLKGISRNWYTYSLSLRNRLLRLIIAKVEIRGYYEIEATIIWKNGFQQKVLIHRPPATSKLDKRWTEEEDELLRTMYQSSSADTLMAALPDRSWKGITLRAWRLKLKRNKGANQRRRWNKEDDRLLKLYYDKGMTHEEIANELGRSAVSITARIQAKGLSKSLSDKKRRVSWESYDLIPLQESSSREGLRG